MSTLLPVVQAFPGARVVVAGDVMLDEYLWGAVTRISPEAPIPVVEVQRTSVVPGGAANVAANIASLGGAVSLVGVVGPDNFGEALQETLYQAGVDVDGVIVDPARQTTVKTRVVAHNQQVVRVDREMRDPLDGGLASEVVEGVARQLRSADVLLLSDYDKGVLPAEITTRIVGHARAAGKRILVDPKGLDYSKYHGASLVTPNLAEAARATRAEIRDEAGIRRAGRLLLEELQAEAILVTCGEQGMWLFELGQEDRHFASRAREVYDVTGAGDTVVSVTALAVAAGASFPEAAQLASEAAGIVVGKVGTATLTAGELAAVLEAGA